VGPRQWGHMFAVSGAMELDLGRLSRASTIDAGSPEAEELKAAVAHVMGKMPTMNAKDDVVTSPPCSPPTSTPERFRCEAEETQDEVIPPEDEVKPPPVIGTPDSIMIRHISPRKLRKHISPLTECEMVQNLCGVALSKAFLARGAEERTAREVLRKGRPRVSLAQVKSWLAENQVNRSELSKLFPAPQTTTPPPSQPSAVCSVALSDEFLARGAEERAARAELRRARPRTSLNAVKTWMADNKVDQSGLRDFFAQPPEPELQADRVL